MKWIHIEAQVGLREPINLNELPRDYKKKELILCQILKGQTEGT